MNTSTAFDSKEHFVSSWPASLDIEFSARPGKSVPSSIKHFGPLRVQRPFYPEKDETCHLYLLHPPGGVVGGDILNITVTANEKSKSLMTTPGATKIYRSNTGSNIHQTLSLEKESTVEWMPQETILFNDAQTVINTHVQLSEGSRLFFWDILCLGLPANNEKFTSGHCGQSLKIFRGKKPILIENNHFEGSSDLMSASWGMRGFYVNAVSVMTVGRSDIVEQIRSVNNSEKNSLFAVTEKQGLVICRYMGNSVEEAKALFLKAWSLWRNSECKKGVVVPRIWGT